MKCLLGNLWKILQKFSFLNKSLGNPPKFYFLTKYVKKKMFRLNHISDMIRSLICLKKKGENLVITISFFFNVKPQAQMEDV